MDNTKLIPTISSLQPSESVVPLVDLQSAYDSGYLASFCGIALFECPFPDRSVRRDLWRAGWSDSHLNLPAIEVKP